MRHGGGTVGRPRGWRGRECGVQNIYIYREGVKKDLWSIGTEEMDEVKSKDRVGRMWVTLGDISMGGGILQVAKKLYGVINL